MQKLCFILLGFLSCMSFVRGENLDIYLIFENEKVQVRLEDNIATREFVQLLPLELEFSDYAGAEKIAKNLPKRLNTTGLNGYTPSVGDLFYFAPWGNLGIFYKSASFHSGLVKFGSLKPEFIAKIQAKKENFIIKFERIK